METNYLESVIKQFEYYKLLGENTFAQISDEKLFWEYNNESNSIATIVKHLWGNMMSRWTDFLTTDGEKDWRNRDSEFDNTISTKQELLDKWNEGWGVFFETIKSLNEEDLEKIIYIRNQGHTVLEAINRQLAHYPYHVGQIVFIGKMSVEKWNSLSIPRGNSNEYNNAKFSKPKEKGHFTDEYINRKTRSFVIITHEVESFIQWKKIFDDALDIRLKAGEISFKVLNEKSNSNNIVHLSEWNSLENAKEFFESDLVKSIRQKAGVKNPHFVYLEEQDSSDTSY